MLKDVAALIGRIGVGVVFIAHGWQKVTEWGLDGTATAFAGMGVPLPTLSAWFAAIVELAGGALLVLGVAMPVVGVLLAVDMLGALVLVHLPNGLLGQGGYELVLVLGVAALALGFNGGSLAVSRLVAGRKAEQRVIRSADQVQGRLLTGAARGQQAPVRRCCTAPANRRPPARPGNRSAGRPAWSTPQWTARGTSW